MSFLTIITYNHPTGTINYVLAHTGVPDKFQYNLEPQVRVFLFSVFNLQGSSCFADLRKAVVQT